MQGDLDTHDCFANDLSAACTMPMKESPGSVMTRGELRGPKRCTIWLFDTRETIVAIRAWSGGRWYWLWKKLETSDSDNKHGRLTIMKLGASPEIQAPSEMIGDSVMYLRSKNASDQDLTTSIAKMTVDTNVSECNICTLLFMPYVLQPGALHCGGNQRMTGFHISRDLQQCGCSRSFSEREYCSLNCN